MLRRLTVAACLLLCWAYPPRTPAEQPLVFESDVQPLLAAKCGKCHSSRVKKGGLDLSSMGGLRRGGESGESVVAATPDESLLWIMVSSGEMPPKGKPPLSAAERTLIQRWIKAGAHAEEPDDTAAGPLNQHDVLPILLLRCAACHGAQIRRGDLDLRTRAAMMQGGRSGPAFVAGDPDTSLMIQRMESGACPPQELLLKFFVKRPPASEVAVLRGWISVGAPEGNVAPDVATREPDPLVTDQDRQHWSFQPPRPVFWGDSVDDFIFSSLQKHGMDFSPEADCDTLIRRAYLDLIGMPPGLAAWQRWRRSPGADWYERMIDELLDSPHYGERWGRYWLDLAGYADSEGGVATDPIRSVAWKYRDYVIRAFNSDKPYDRFLVEQLAGDELVDHENAPMVTEQMVENLVATGFLRMGVDQTGSRTMNFVPERLGVINDAITIVSEGVMGLTIGCARCHSHKYDPIPSRDFYRFKAIFQGVFDEHDWLTFRNRSLKVDVPQRVKRVEQVNPPLNAEVSRLSAQLETATSELRLDLLRHHYPGQAAADRSETLRALKTTGNNRTQQQNILVEMLQRADALPESEQPPSVLRTRHAVRDLQMQIDKLKRQMEPPLTIRALWDRGQPSPTYILHRGEHTKPRRLVGPGVPSVLTDGRTPFIARPPFPHGTQKTGRRLAFARWLTRPDHPMTARVMVNRVWYHHFGSGLVRTLENFGTQGDRPTHPELLDWLAVKFVENNWSIKELHRLIMNSRTYRQSSRVNEKHLDLDPQNRLLSRMTVRRMDAEALRDSLLFVTGRLRNAAGGPPDPVSVSRDGLVSAVPDVDGRWRRSVYLQYRRTETPTIMEVFDYPEMGPNCLTRNVSTVSLQPLMLMNSKHVHDLAAAFAARVQNILSQKNAPDNANRVEIVHQLAVNRPPSGAERDTCLRALARLQSLQIDEPQTALAVYCHTILNSAAFQYVD